MSSISSSSRAERIRPLGALLSCGLVFSLFGSTGFAGASGAELLSVTEQVSVVAENDDYVTARSKALDQLAENALAKAVAAVGGSDSIEASRSSQFKSAALGYLLRRKIISESIDPERKEITISARLDFSLEGINRLLEEAGLSPRAGSEPRIALWIDEPDDGALSSLDAIKTSATPSKSEEIIADLIRAKTAILYRRADIVRHDLSELAEGALRGEKESSRSLAAAIGADLILLGESIVDMNSRAVAATTNLRLISKMGFTRARASGSAVEPIVSTRLGALRGAIDKSVGAAGSEIAGQIERVWETEPRSPPTP